MKSHSHPVIPFWALGIALLTTTAAFGNGRGEAPIARNLAWVGLGAHQIATDPADAVVSRYCTRCHSERRLSGNLSLEGFTLEGIVEQGEVAEKMIRKLRAGMMPPPGARRPTLDSLDALMLSLERRMDELAEARPNPGSRSFQRLNRAEYHASVRDLLGIEVDVNAFLPPDTKSANFDNIADVQVPSVTLMEGYLRAAFQVARDALGDPEASPTSTPYQVPRTRSQKDRVEGAPFGTRGGVSVVHTFPADGKYVFRAMPYAAPEGELYGRTLPGEQIEISIDGERVAVLDIDRWMSDSDPLGMSIISDSIDVRAGQRRVTAAFVKQIDGPVDDLITPQDHTLADTQIGLDYGITTLPHLQRFTILGPFEPTGVSETETRKRVFTCRPTSPGEAAPCARSIVTRIAERAYRRPLTAGDADGLMTFYEQGSADDGFEAGVRLALQAILASPHFVFRTETAPEDLGADAVYPITDVDLASRLSFFLWGTVPDDELRHVAADGTLSDPAVLSAQVERLLEDPRSAALASRFAAQWLRLDDLDKVHPDALDYPYYDHTLAEAMRRETELLFDHLVREDASVLDLITADFTVRERASRPALPHPGRHRAGVQEGPLSRRSPSGSARARQHPDPDIPRQPDLSRLEGEVGDGGAHGDPAAAAAAGTCQTLR